MKTLLNNLFYILAGLLIGAVIWLVSTPPRGKPVLLVPPPTPGPLHVHVAGAVVSPGVYTLPPGARLLDAVNAAGGLLPESVPDAVNLAEKLADGLQVHVPFAITASGSETGQGSGAGTTGTGKININTATQAQLESLPGIGPSIAQRIIEYRDRNGAFTDTIDITLVTGIGPSTYAKIKDRITTDQ